jgi:hypothetical protein
MLYRAAARPAHLVLALELAQPGDIWIDSVTIEVLQPPGAPSQVARQ